jgi:hypothetical protein
MVPELDGDLKDLGKLFEEKGFPDIDYKIYKSSRKLFNPEYVMKLAVNRLILLERYKRKKEFKILDLITMLKEEEEKEAKRKAENDNGMQDFKKIF